MDYKYIKSNRQLAAYLKRFDDVKCAVIALDTEAELNLHAYGEKLCLVQIFDGTSQFLIDPVNISTDLLKSFFENRNIFKVIYDAGSDLSLLKHVYDIEMKSILDLRPAVALLEYPKQDLHSVIAADLGVILNHKTRFQKYNWTRRPIEPEAVEYALSDVLYLIKLKDILLKKLCDRQLMERYILDNLKIQNRDYTRNPEDKYHRINGYRYLHEYEKLMAREITDIIDKYAREYNIPAHWLINRNDIPGIIKDPTYIDKIRLPDRFSAESRQNILIELKTASTPK